MDLDQKLGYSRKDFDNRRGLNSFRKTIIPANPPTPFPLGIIYNEFVCQLSYSTAITRSHMNVIYAVSKRPV